MRIAIVGCGNMGTAYARSFRKYGLVKPEDLLLVVRREERAETLRRWGTVALGIGPEIAQADLVVVAVKPQDFATIAGELAGILGRERDQVVLSIMAGITLGRLRDSLGVGNVVRAMPNTPAQIGMGITAYATGAELTMRQTLMVEQLLNTTGRAMHLGDERLLDAVTAVSGSGPAYFFEIVRNMVDTAVRLGLEPHVAAALVKQTMLGSFHLLEHSERTPEELIQSVTSKGGTTEAAFKVLRGEDLAGTLDRALTAAATRARELSGA